MLSLLLSRILGLVRDMVMAGKFGSDWRTDAYTLAFSIPDLLFFLIAGGALSSAFIPVFSEHIHKKKEKEAWHIFSSVATIMSIIVIAFIIVAWIFAMSLAHKVAPGKPTEQLELVARMSRIVLPAQYAFFIGGLMFGTLYAKQRFAVPGLGPNVYNLGIITGALVISHFVSPGIVGMSYGALVGACIGNLLIPALEMRKIGAQFRPTVDLKHPGVRKVFKLMLPVVFGLSLPGVYVLIMRGFASYYPEGTNTWLYYANLLMQAPLGIFGQSLAIAVFPTLTQFYAEEKMNLFRRQLSSTMRTVIYLTVPVSAFMAVAAPQIVSALYQHGKFTPHDTSMVAGALQWFCLGIGAWCLHPVLMRAFFAIQNSVTPIVLGTVTTAIFIGLVMVLRQTPLGFYALPLASSISAMLLAVLMTVFVIPKIGGLELGGIFVTLGKSLLASALFVGTTYGVLQTPLAALSTHHKLMAVGLLALLALPGAAVYFWATRMLKMPESEYLDRAFAKLKNRGQARAELDAASESEVEKH